MEKTIEKIIKVPFRFKGVHNCEAVVLACVDFRFWKETAQFIKEGLEIESYDFPKLPGGVKPINDYAEGVSMQCIAVPCDLHHVKKIVLVNHSDCGAYGGLKKFNGDRQAEKEFHLKELKKTKEFLSKKYPDKQIIPVYANLDENMEEVEFIVLG